MAVYTLGCKVNQAESEELSAGLLRAGHAVVRDPGKADLCVVNTCSVTAESDRKCRKLVRGLANRGAAAIVVAGCYAEVCPEELAALPGVVRVLPNSRKELWLQEVLALLPEGRKEKPPGKKGRTRVFLKVQDGCERGCSYCIVPRARGKERSRPLAEILREAGRALETRPGEVVLCGVNLGRYGKGTGRGLDHLVRELLAAGEGFRIRLSSIELEDLQYGWLEEWAAARRVCPHLHLPLQSGDEGILRDMGRGYSPDDFRAAAQTLRRVWPEAALTTEVMVGYPGESEEAFMRTLEILRETRPSRVHVFRFSPRPGTRAWSRDDRVDAWEAERRSREVRALAEELRLGYIEERKGETRELLVEKLAEKEGETVALGTTEDYIKGAMRGFAQRPRPGAITVGKIVGAAEGRALLEAAGGTRVPPAAGGA